MRYFSGRTQTCPNEQASRLDHHNPYLNMRIPYPGTEEPARRNEALAVDGSIPQRARPSSIVANNHSSLHADLICRQHSCVNDIPAGPTPRTRRRTFAHTSTKLRVDRGSVVCAFPAFIPEEPGLFSTTQLPCGTLIFLEPRNPTLDKA